ncbi:ABC transporter substrate-binding protein [Fictibacillus sp. 7GRE50]|uniref:ABC transporter substrate-binding protein n=1 Tax=unclassified Fictibacillus TaxID=2644029 RepID=UPI0018CEEC08|nr:MULTISPECIES: ABC transporter substrate-binding protein [unclassified Fictibacillus]MBH0166879.1 ABC transporter substrate-binding protein [Fictibacillus sp. 7GRE50]MBH0173499.1 ABC transporter substrate-binding protein [Fictibacillus sp. 23RED33]
MKNGIKLIIISLIMLAMVSGCQNDTQKEREGKKDSAEVNQSAEPYLSFKDFDGELVTLKEKPKNIVILKDEVLYSFYQVGGKAAGITNAFTIDPPEEAKDVPKVGFMHEVNIEKVFALKPDLVVGQRFTHGNLRKTFKEANIPFANLNTQSIEDIRKNTLLMGKITGNDKKAEKLINEMDSKINQVIDQVPDKKEKPTYAILTVMGDASFIEQGPTISVDMANQLKLRNVTESLDGEVMAGYIPFSMEEMVKINPDYLFVLSHTTNEDAKKMIDNNYKKNPAWNSLSAVSNDQIYFLPREKFVMAPGVDVVDSYKYLSELVYSTQTN